MQRNDRKEPGLNAGLYVFECVMSLLYLGVSYILIFTKLFEDTVSDKNIRLLLGLLLGFYGIFRVYRAIKKFQNK